MPDTDKIHRRILNLESLANGNANQNEAASARRQADKLRKKYADILPKEATPEPAKEVLPQRTKRDTYPTYRQQDEYMDVEYRRHIRAFIYRGYLKTRDQADDIVRTQYKGNWRMMVIDTYRHQGLKKEKV